MQKMEKTGFSPDDPLLLDNEVSQFLTVDGRKHTTFDVPKTGVSLYLNLTTRWINIEENVFYSVVFPIMSVGLAGNCTRASYTSSGAYIVIGACEDSKVSIAYKYS